MTDASHQTRREFLAHAALGAVALGVGTGCREVAPAGARLDRIGVQLYTVRRLMAENVEETLRSVAAIGYQEVEFAGYYERAPDALRATLDSLGLTTPSAHVDLNDLSPDRSSRVFDAAATLGHRYVVVAWFPPELRRSLDDWKRMAERFNGIGEVAKTRGVRFAYHNHDFEFAPVEVSGGARVPFDVLLEETDPSLVMFELDLYWIAKAGGDTSAYFNRWPGRFPMVHVKDSGGSPAHEMRDVGQGALPFAELFAQRDKAGIEHFFVEHDEPADPIASIRTSHAHLRELTF